MVSRETPGLGFGLSRCFHGGAVVFGIELLQGVPAGPADYRSVCGVEFRKMGGADNLPTLDFGDHAPLVRAFLRVGLEYSLFRLGENDVINNHRRTNGDFGFRHLCCRLATAGGEVSSGEGGCASE